MRELIDTQLVAMESRFGNLLRIVFTNNENVKRYAALGFLQLSSIDMVVADLRKLADALEAEIS